MKNDIRKQTIQEGELVPIIFDYVFTSIFNKQSNIKIVESFLSCYFEIPLNQVRGNVTILSRNLELEHKKTANKQVDLILKLGNDKINIELSTRISSGIIDRNIIFACNVHSRSYQYGDCHYNNIGSTVQINLIYDSHFHMNEMLKETYYLQNQKGKILSEKFRIDLLDVEIGESLCYTDSETRLSRWCKAFTARTVEDFEKAIGEGLMEQDTKELLKEEVIKYSQDEDVIALYSNYTREELERNTLMNDAKKDGWKEGLEQGLEQGKLDSKREIALNLLKKNIDIVTISEITKLTMNEIRQIAKEKNVPI